ncbi:MAG TPA: purine-nucleoside phosphorylase, partial [Burkholderiales bacterium]|nr:purine-nucleoside phosphorylase [Burkholderiales bacterium]
MNNFLLSDAKDAVSYIKSIFKSEIPKVAVILGSGLGDFTKIVKIIHSIPYKEIPSFPHNSEVQGHKGNLTLAMMDNGKEVLLMEGRFHYYQGYTPQQVVMPFIVLHLLGVDTLIICNAAGGCNPHFKQGDLMI